MCFSQRIIHACLTIVAEIVKHLWNTPWSSEKHSKVREVLTLYHIVNQSVSITPTKSSSNANQYTLTHLKVLLCTFMSPSLNKTSTFYVHAGTGSSSTHKEDSSPYQQHIRVRFDTRAQGRIRSQPGMPQRYYGSTTSWISLPRLLVFPCRSRIRYSNCAFECTKWFEARIQFGT